MYRCDCFYDSNYMFKLNSLLITLIFILCSSVIAGVPVISDLSDNTVLEQADAEVYDLDITFANGADYADGFLRYSLSGATANDIFSLTDDDDVNVDGAISISGGYVYLGNGSGRVVIGIIDSTENGLSGQPLKILFFRAVDNGGFESGDTSDWTVYNVQYPGDGALDGGTIPWKRLTDAGNGLTGTGEISIGTENSMSYATAVDTSVVSSGTYSLRLQSSGTITHANTGVPTVGDNPESGYGSIHGPYVECTPFTAFDGDTIYVDWSAVHTSDWYEVLGYLIASGNDGTFSDGNETEILLFKQRGDEQGWTTSVTAITSDDTYKFKFVSGTYDATGGKAVGAYLYIDNIRIVTGLTIDDTVITNIAQNINYQNTADISSDLVRNLTVDVETNSGDTDSDTKALRVTTIVDPTPFVTINSGLTLNEGATATILPSLLKSSDNDSYDEEITYTVTTSPENGQLENTDTSGTSINTFSQQDIRDSKVVYVHSGNETTADSFNFSISDGTNELTGQVFSITITPQNDSPAVTSNFGRNYPEAGFAIINNIHLCATDADNDSLSLVYTITTAPVNGIIENTDSPGNVITSFTQQDLNNGKIRYVHGGGITTTDSFIFKVSDGTAEVTNQTFNIALGEDDQPLATLVEGPSSVTNAVNYNIKVGGIGVVEYRYKLDDEVVWSSAVDINTSITFSLSTEGTHTLYVIGKDDSETWQEGGDATTYIWRIDTTPPVAKISNAPEGTIGINSAELSIRGDIEEATGYKYRVNDGTWSLQRSVDLPINLTDLEDGSQLVEVIAMDAAGNWQTVISASDKSWVVDRSEYTLEIGGVPEGQTSETSATITVSGLNIVAYMYRFDSEAWTYSEIYKIINLTELEDGEHTLTVRGLLELGGVGDTGDGSYNRTWVVDTTKAETTDLTASESVPTATAVKLTWTWSSDTSLEVIQKYRVWYSTALISENNIDDATEVYCDLKPNSQGETESFFIDKLQPGTLYYFALKTIDLADNVSELSNIAEYTTSDTLPIITTLALVTGGNFIDNSTDRDITITGSQFINIEGDNIIRFENESSVFDIVNTSGDEAELSATVPMGAPVGTYNVRVVNKYGVSLPLAAAYTVTEATVPVPEVTNLSPAIVAIGTPTVVIVSGENFTSPIAGVWLVDNDGVQTALTTITSISAEVIQVTVDVTTGFQEGLYHIKVENSDGTSNNISSVRLGVIEPIDLEIATDPVVTTGIVAITDGNIPVKILLTTDNRDEIEPVSSLPTAISLEILSPGVLEENVNGTWGNYSGIVNPPRELPLSPIVSSRLGNYSSEFSLGAENTLHMSNGENMLMMVEVTIPTDAPIPSLYSVLDNGKIVLAGVSGSLDGVDYITGGSVIAARENVPQEGYTTYTIGALVNELENHYAVGSDGPSDSYGPCFIGFLKDKSDISEIFILLIVITTTYRFRKILLFCGVFLLLCFIASQPGYAQDSETLNKKWYLLFGGGFQQISEDYNSIYYGANRELTIRNNIYPVLRLGWNITDRIALEAGFRRDIMSGRMEKDDDNGRDNIKGISLLFGPVYKFDQRNSKFVGNWTPFLKADIGYRKIKSGLSYAVNDYDPTYGVECAVGILKGSFDFRVGYALYSHDAEDTAAGYSNNGSSSSLGLSGIFMEITYRFSFGDTLSEKIKTEDSGGDGIPDNLDSRPQSLAGIQVDEKGCHEDSDGDGVPDGLDKCKETPIGVIVDEYGCPIDSDDDGVADYLDICPDSPNGATIDERGCWLLKGIKFDVYKYDIKQDMIKTLEDIVKVLGENPNLKIEIQGYTDSMGNDEMNRKISDKRANAVRDYLIEQGIEQNNLTAKGYGEENPVVSNDTSEGRAKNRRVELKTIK